MPAFLVFDIGTSGGKAGLVDEEGKVIAVRKEGWSAREPPGLEGYGSEFDPREVESKLVSATRQVLQESRVKASDVLAVSTTSLRFGYAFLDALDAPLYLGSNMDGRGFFEQEVIEEKLGDGLYEITGLYPSMLFGLAKLLWFKENAPEKFGRVSKLMSLDDWWTYKLSGEFITDHASASTTGFYNVKKRDWSDEILSAFRLGAGILPKLTESGTRAGQLNEASQSVLGLNRATVAVGGPDTQCGLLGSGCLSERDLGVVAGATAPCQLVLASPALKQAKKVWLGGYMVPGTYVVESNAGQCGLTYDWAVRTYLGQGDYAFAQAEQLLSAADPSPSGITSVVGSQIMDLERMHLMRPSVTLFPSPVVPPFFRADTGSFLKAVLEEACYAISCNIDLLELQSGVTPNSLRVTGGLTKSRTFCRTLSNVTSKQVCASSEADGTVLGAALCAMVGSGASKSLKEAGEHALHPSEVSQPDEALKGSYTEAKQKWRDLYLEMTRLTEEGRL